MADYTDIDKLRELAEKHRPTPMRWIHAEDGDVRFEYGDGCKVCEERGVCTVGRLVAELVGLRTEVDQLRGEIAATNVYGRFNGHDWLTGFDAITARRSAAAVPVVGAEEPTDQAESKCGQPAEDGSRCVRLLDHADDHGDSRGRSWIEGER